MSNWAPEPKPGEPCPRCHRRMPIPKEDKTPRKRGQVNVTVPADAEENGAEVLKALMDAARDEITDALGYDATTPYYYVLCAVLSDWLSSRKEAS